MERYLRQIALPRLGQQGQQKLGESKVLIVGLGGLGSPAALYLAAAGVGTIGLVDGDEVAVHNLNRQLLFNTEDVGKRKADVALKHLQALNPQLNYRKYDIIISSTNGAKIIRNYDLVLSCVDRFESRYLLNELCVAANVPMIDGAIQNLNGYVFPIIPGETACYHCLHEGMQDQAGKASFRRICWSRWGVNGCRSCEDDLWVESIKWTDVDVRFLGHGVPENHSSA